MGVLQFFVNCFSFIFYALAVVGMFKVFEKMNIEGWKSIIPFYNDYLYAGKTWDQKYIIYFWCAFILSRIVALIAGIGGFIGFLFGLVSFAFLVLFIVARARFCYWKAKAFGYDVGFAVGLFFLPFVFEIILGFGDAQYQGNVFAESGSQY